MTDFQPPQRARPDAPTQAPFTEDAIQIDSGSANVIKHLSDSVEELKISVGHNGTKIVFAIHWSEYHLVSLRDATTEVHGVSLVDESRGKVQREYPESGSYYPAKSGAAIGGAYYTINWATGKVDYSAPSFDLGTLPENCFRRPTREVVSEFLEKIIAEKIREMR